MKMEIMNQGTQTFFDLFIASVVLIVARHVGLSFATRNIFVPALKL